ncbi:MAG TPA: anthranilate phosphoribosyltransferase [Anaerolineae bacterium]|nr:anthranilate phosphoribosyltransferase [Anaerolineae bacterium]HIQ05012.1 anthranilate phosphoribosyltransferase [Anaerolineae bacterium]
MIRQVIAKLLDGEDLSAAEAEAAMNEIMAGEATSAQIGAFLTALRMKGETVEEITGCARAMRSNARPVPHTRDGSLVDTCGTGGDRAGTFNVSTTAAFVVAGHGVPVAKHGNRSVSSKCGSADVLEALGLDLSLSAKQVAACIDQVGIGFLFAPVFHPAMKHAIGPRRELGVRTVFNILGPLTNPAGATRQVIGVYDPALTEPMAHVLGELGARSAFVVHGAGGLDELSTLGTNRVSWLHNGQVTTFQLDPSDLGLPRASLADLRGGDATENAQILRRILSGREQGPKRDVVLLNAAAALATDSNDWTTALAQARISLDSGAALRKLDDLIQFARTLSGCQK